MARQYFGAQSADSLIVASSFTPTTTKEAILSFNAANQCFPLPFGVNSGPFAGQVFHFTAGGIWTTPGSGTLTIDPFHGPGTAALGSVMAGGTSMGISPAQSVAAVATNIPWILDGYLVYRLISNVATTSTAWLTGMWHTQGTLATAGSGCTIPFGSTAVVSVDTTGSGTLGTYGALNFAFTFSVSGATVVTEWTSMQSLN